MLVLSRRNGEAVIVGGGALGRVIRIKVIQVSSGKVKLGFEVDGDIPVHREEVWQRLCDNGELPASTAYAKPI